MTKNNKKLQLTKKIMEYTKDGEFDISNFRINNPSDYSKIAYYFGSINNMLNELKLVKTNKDEKLIFRDLLAYDLLTILRKNYTLEEIANKYNVSRALVNQLYQQLDINVKENKLKKILKN